jgi:toxin-antitoxin system PIN domain toxin
VIGLDTNVLVHAHRTDSPHHGAALAALDRAGAAPAGWAIPWPCAHEFVAVVSGKAFGAARTPLPVAFDALDAWLSHPRCRSIGETAGHAALLRRLMERAGLAGGAVHDARIAAICLAHGVSELWTRDRDFSRFPDLRTRDPLIPSVHDAAAGGYEAGRAKGLPRRRG